MLKLPTCLLCLSMLLTAAAWAAPAASADEQAVIGTFQSFLTGLNHRDKAAMMATLVPGGSGTFLRDGKPVQLSFEVLTDKLSQPGPDSHEERIHDAQVRVDGDVAILFAPFEFLLAGKLDHCGTDIASFVKTGGRWLIAFIGDNHRTTCHAQV